MTTQGLQQKVNRLLSSNVSVASAGMITCLRGVSELIPKGGNDLSARRRLQHQLEIRELSHCKELLRKFETVSKVFDATQATLDNLSSTVESASARVGAAREAAGSLVERATKLETQKAQIERKSAIVTQLLKQFQLEEHHSRALGSSQVDAAMLDAIERVNAIRAHCHVLLESYQKVGLDMIEDLSKRQERAYRVLFHWIQDQVPQCAERSEGVPFNSVFVRGLRLLQQRPAYFSHCLDMLANARRVVMIKRFIAALCRGGPNGQPRPIEIHAGDPVRYVSDMLAWVHQALAMEREFFNSLLVQANSSEPSGEFQSEDEKGLRDQKQKVAAEKDSKQESAAERGQDGAEIQVQVLNATSRVLEGVARPLSVRVEQSLVFQPSTVVSYNLRSILDFYNRTLQPLLDPTGAFCEAMTNLVAKAQTTFESLVSGQVKQLNETPAPYTNDLSPPDVLQRLLDQMSSLVKVHEACLVPAEHKDHAFIPVLESLVAGVRKAAEASSQGLDGANKAIFELNILGALEMALQSSESKIRELRSKVANEIKSQLGGLVRSQADSFMAKAGILEIYQAVKTGEELKDEKSLQRRLSEFYSYIVGVSTLLTPEMDRVGDPWIRVTTREGVRLIVSEAYRLVHTNVKNRFPPEVTANILKHDPEYIHTLLDL